MLPFTKDHQRQSWPTDSAGQWSATDAKRETDKGLLPVFLRSPSLRMSPVILPLGYFH